MAEPEPRIDTARDEGEPDEDRPRTKRELARRSDGDEIGGEESGRGAPTENPEQFEEFAGTEPEPEPPGEAKGGRPRADD